MKVKLLSHVQLFATPWTVAHQAPLSMGFSRQQYWSGLPLPSPRDLSDPGIKPGSPALQADALPSEPSGTPSTCKVWWQRTPLWNQRNMVQSLTLLWKSCYSSLHSPINWTQHVTHILFDKQYICGSDTQSSTSNVQSTGVRNLHRLSQFNRKLEPGRVNGFPRSHS